MSTETTNKKIKIDNGTTFGKTYTDKAIDAKLPTDLIASANKLSLGVGNSALGNGVNLDGFTYDEATKTLKASGGKSVPPTLWLIDLNSGEIRTSITEEEKTNLDNGLYNQVVYMQDETDYLGYQLPTKLITDNDNEVYSFATFSVDSISLKLTGISLVVINIGEKDETTNTYPITFDNNVQIALPGADTRTVVLFNRPNQILAPNDGGADIILPLPADASTSTYVLKAVNGTVQWVKEV